MIRNTVLIIVLYFLSANNVQAEVITVKESGFTVKNSIIVPAKAKQAWQLFHTQVNQWWPSEHTWWGESSTLKIDTFSGGCFCENNGDKSAEHMRISYVEPNVLLRMTGGQGPLQGLGMYGALDWRFKKHESGTEIILSYTVNGIIDGGFDKLAAIVDKVQHAQLINLQSFIKTQN